MNYSEKLRKAIQSNNSTLCVGLDPVADKIPDSILESAPDIPSAVITFCREVIEATRDNCCAYKPNLAFFEALGPKAFEVLQKVRESVPSNKIVVADAKRGDIISTARQYAKTFFEWLDADAVTLNPLMGFESLEPFYEYPEKAGYVLTLTSNKGAADFFLNNIGSYDTMSHYIAAKLNELNATGHTHLGMVVGATQTSMLEKITDKHPEGALLIPGLGKQGGKVEEIVKVLKNKPSLPLINSSRSIIYAGNKQQNWQKAVYEAARDYNKKLRSLTQQYV